MSLKEENNSWKCQHFPMDLEQKESRKNHFEGNQPATYPATVNEAFSKGISIPDNECLKQDLEHYHALEEA
jgi:hypothetical protein